MKMAWSGDKESAKDESESLSKRLANQSCDFTASATLHGLQHVGNREHNPVRRWLWLVLVLGLAGYLIYTLSLLYIRYQSFRHKSVLSVSDSLQIPFPAFTFCLKDCLVLDRLRSVASIDLLENFFYSRDSLDWDDPRLQQELGNITMQQIFNTASISLEEIFENGELSFTPLNASTDFVTNDYFMGLFPFRCFTFNGPESYNKRGDIMASVVDKLVLTLSIPQVKLLPFSESGGLAVAVHHPWEAFSKWHYINVAFGTYATLAMQAYQFVYLPAPYNSQGGKDCVKRDSSDPRFHLQHFQNYSSINCFAEESSRLIRDACNCTTIDDFGSSDLPHCTLRQLDECVSPMFVNVTLQVLTNNTCALECQQKTIEMRPNAVPYPSRHYTQYISERGLLSDNVTERDSVKLEVKFDSTKVFTTEHVPDVTWEDIYSEAGGQMGLFVGASLLSVAELLEFVFCLFWTSLKDVLQRNRLSTRIHRSD